MKIKVLKLFKDYNLTDEEKVFAYLATQYLEKYGIEEDFTIDAFDLKVLMFGTTEGFISHKTISPDLQKIFKFGIYSDRRCGFRLRKDILKKYAKSYRGRLRIGYDHVTLKSTKAIAIYVYLLGALNHQESWLNMDAIDQFGHTEIDYKYENEPSVANREQRKVNPLEFSQLLKIARLDL